MYKRIISNIEKTIPSEEIIVKVNNAGIVISKVPKSERKNGGTFAVELVAIINQDSGKLVLFERGQGAQDMKGVYALHSGTINSTDLLDNPGEKLSFETAQKTASRELQEELGFSLDSDRLTPVSQFFMPKEGFNLHFSLFTIKLSQKEINTFKLDHREIIRVKEYTYVELKIAKDIGHALQHKRDLFLSLIN